MRVFVTGASGFIGNAVAVAFRQRGHQVFGLVRSQESAKKLQACEIIPVVGDLKQKESYASALLQAEIFVHTAFDGTQEGVTIDLNTIDTFIQAAKKSDLPKQLIYTSGCWIYGDTKDAIVDEASPINPLEMVKWRKAHEDKVLQAASDKLRALVIRPGCVYGQAGGITSFWFSSAANGTIHVSGNGKNYCSMIHIHDLATAYVLAAEKELSGLVLNVNNGHHHTVNEVVLACQKVSGAKKIEYLSIEEAKKEMGRSAEGLATNQRIANERLFHLLGFRPNHASFIDEIGIYYQSWQRV